MYLYIESFGKNLAATILGLLVFAESVTPVTGEEKSIAFLILTITVPSVISGIVTVSIELIKSRRGRK